MAASREEGYARERRALLALSGVINQTGESTLRYAREGRIQLDSPTDTVIQITGDAHAASSHISISDPEILSAPLQVQTCCSDSTYYQ